jgi:ABC-2 type transport system permease protein
VQLAVFNHLSISPPRALPLSRPLRGTGGRFPVGVWLGIVAVMGAALLGMAVAEFQRTE